MRDIIATIQLISFNQDEINIKMNRMSNVCAQ